MTHRGHGPHDPRGYYRLLGIEPGATADEIRRAYRRQARRSHPDHNPDGGSHERMARINEAYDTLGDATARAAYDRAARGGQRDAGDEGDQAPRAGAAHERQDASRRSYETGRQTPPRPVPSVGRVDFGALAPGARRRRRIEVHNFGGPFRQVRVVPQTSPFTRLVQIHRPDTLTEPVTLEFEAWFPDGAAPHAGQLHTTARILFDAEGTDLELTATTAVPAPRPPAAAASGTSDTRRTRGAALTVVGIAIIGALMAWAVGADDTVWEQAGAEGVAESEDPGQSTAQGRGPEPAEPSDERGTEADHDLPLEPVVPDAADSGSEPAASESEVPESEDHEVSADPHDVVAELDVRTVWAVEAGDGAVWAITGGGDGAVHMIDGDTNRVEATVPVDYPGSLAVGLGSVWISHYEPGELPGYGQDRLLRIDADTASVTGDITLDTFGGHVVVGAGSVWVSGGNDPRGVLRIDPSSLEVLATIPIDAPSGGMVFADDALWVANGQNVTVTRIDPAANTVTDTIDLDVGQRGCCTNAKDVASGADAIWVGVTDEPDSGHVARIDPATRTQTATIRIGRTSQDYGGTMIAASDSAVWVANVHDATVSRIDPDTDHVTAVIATDRLDENGAIIGDRPQTVAIADDTVWVGSNALMRLAPP